ncbi:MAG TPA: hypothetical protein VFT29_07860 [Gemmatimonadaceae bacterium]|nr:hypothetical protein [Gemmatimonadaceae bacterium]
MILADTSVWIDHFRRRNARLVQELESDKLNLQLLVFALLNVAIIVVTILSRRWVEARALGAKDRECP